MPVQKITRIAFLSAILYVSKVVLEFLPNVELISLLVILFTLVYGKEVFLVIAVFNLFEFIQWGLGTWWVSYLYAWPLLGLITLLLKNLIKEEFLVWSIVSGIFGLIFGSLFALVYIPIDRAYALSYWISGLPWDVWHAVWNFVLMMILGKPVYFLLKKIGVRE